jgi:hypothetical protein
VLLSGILEEMRGVRADMSTAGGDDNRA